jgi:hypothetical protein
MIRLAITRFRAWSSFGMLFAALGCAGRIVDRSLPLQPEAGLSPAETAAAVTAAFREALTLLAETHKSNALMPPVCLSRASLYGDGSEGALFAYPAQEVLDTLRAEGHTVYSISACRFPVLRGSVDFPKPPGFAWVAWVGPILADGAAFRVDLGFHREALYAVGMRCQLEREGPKWKVHDCRTTLVS